MSESDPAEALPPFRLAVIPVTPLQQNCSLLWCEATKRAAVIDPGGDVAQILAAAQSVGVEIESILLTHGHIDHAGGAAELKAELERSGRSVPVIGPHVADKFLLDHLPQTGLKYGIFGARVVTPDRWLDQGDTVSVGSARFDVLHCPGHSPGSVVFVSRDVPFALVGDVLFHGSVGRTDLPGGDHAALMRSITDKLLPLGDDLVFLCGHGPMSTIGTERESNPFLQ